jgi:hypothetical protein
VVRRLGNSNMNPPKVGRRTEKQMLSIYRKVTRLAFLSLGITGAASAATVTVGKPSTPCPDAQYSSINEAVEAAAAGDVIAICPGVYAEQILISKPLTIRGISVEGVSRVLLQPNPMVPIGGLPFAAVIAVVNTSGVSIQNVALDASNNSVNGCDIGLSGIHFYNASGDVDHTNISGAQLKDPTSCQTLVSYPLRLGGGIGVLADTDGFETGPFRVVVQRSTIQGFSASGIIATGNGVTVASSQNSISGVGPSLGVKQFAVVVANGAVGNIVGNMINEGSCGALSIPDCVNLRSEGVLFRAVGDGSTIDSNYITNAQAGIFINGANQVRVTNNIIRNIDALHGIYIQGTAAGGFTNSVISGNMIYDVTPLNAQNCGILEVPGSGVGDNVIRGNTVHNAYCGVAHVAADAVSSGVYNNVLFNTLNIELPLPPALEPGEAGPTLRLLHSKVE